MSSKLVLAYRVVSSLALPFIARKRINKLRRAGQTVDRAHEVLGHATAYRPLGPLIWIHAASVEDTKSSLPLIRALQDLQPALRFLITSETPASAEVIAMKGGEGCVHQFAPLDAGGPVRRFLRHWRPDMGIFVERKIWPNMIETATRASLPLALVNAHLSERSASRWIRFDRAARQIFGCFGLIHCANQSTTDAFHKIRLRHARRGVNLKSITLPLMVDPLERAQMQKAFGDRPLWSAISTHPGEEDIIVSAHTRLRQSHPDSGLILAPHHPERGAEIRANIMGHSVAQRSLGESPDPHTSIFLADTVEETALWLKLAPICCLCGSFSDAGGHTPYEAAAAQTALLHGPFYGNHAEAYARFSVAQASIEVTDAESLATRLDLLIREPDMANALTKAAAPLAEFGRADLAAMARQCLALAQITLEQDTAP